MLGLLETLLNEDVLIFEEDLSKVDVLLKDYPDLITDIIKVHSFAKDNEDVIIAEYIYPTEDNKLIYELGTFGVKEAVRLSMAIDMLGVRSKNLIVSVTYPKEDIEDEGD
jgi:hypothetical protein